MNFDPTGDWLTQARRCPSPNCDARPANAGIDLLVVHGISLPPGEFGGPHIDALFCNQLDADAHSYFAGLRGLRVSAHLLLRRDGEVVQYVPFSARAWHAGVSSFRGRERCNDFSIGVELEGCDDHPYADAQYDGLATFARLARRRWPLIDVDRIVGHCHVAPGRKTDPGDAFDWPRLREALAAGR